ncbi:PDZ domain, partial [Trinorchestia longiramus]
MLQILKNSSEVTLTVAMTSQLVPTTRTQYEALVTSSSSHLSHQAFASHQTDPRSPAGADSSTHLPDLGVFPSEQGFEGSSLAPSASYGPTAPTPALTFTSTSASALTNLTGDQPPTRGKGSQAVTSTVDQVSGAVAAGVKGSTCETSLGAPNASSAPSSSPADFYSPHKLTSDRPSGGESDFQTKEGRTRDEIVSSSGQMIGGVDMDGSGMICSGGSATDPRSVASASDVVVLAQRYSWVEPCGRPVSPPADFNPRLHGHQVVEVMCSVAPDESLGLMIRGGVEYGLGIFITGVDVASAADRCGIKVGDQVLEVNNECFLSVTHDTAVSALKYSRSLRLKLRRVGKLPRSCTVFSRRPFHSKESVRSECRATS